MPYWRIAESNINTQAFKKHRWKAHKSSSNLQKKGFEVSDCEQMMPLDKVVQKSTGPGIWG